MKGGKGIGRQGLRRERRGGKMEQTGRDI